jgi:hypothetical protein
VGGLVPNRQHHRGPNPEDPLLFTEATRRILLLALEEAAYLLDHGYATDSVLDLVSRRHELRVRQRTAMQRSMCSSQQRQARKGCCVAAACLKGNPVEIDGFNQIISLEVALSRGLLLRGSDGAYRDLAGLRGSYHPVDETERALSLLGTALGELGVTSARFYLDQPVSNSGRLRHRILEHAQAWNCDVDAKVVPNPDRDLYGKSLVISSDAAVLDRASSWFNLTEYLLNNHIGSASVLDLGPSSS